MFSLTLWQQYRPELANQVDVALEAQNDLLRKHPELQIEESDNARREGLNAQRAALTKMLSSGLISDGVYEELVTEIDRAIEINTVKQKPKSEIDKSE